MSRLLLAGVLSALAAGSGAQAADPPNALSGPLIKGVCLLSREAVLANAKAAVAVDARLKQLTDQAQAEVNTARAPIDADSKALQADAAKTPAPPSADIDKRRAAILGRYQTVQDLADQRNREIAATRTKQLERLNAEMQPVLAAAYKARGCGLLLNRDAVLAGNMGGDLTADVVKGMDAKAVAVSFDREVLPPANK